MRGRIQVSWYERHYQCLAIYTGAACQRAAPRLAHWQCTECLLFYSFLTCTFNWWMSSGKNLHINNNNKKKLKNKLSLLLRNTILFHLVISRPGILSHLKSFIESAVPPIRLYLMINMMTLKRCVAKENYLIALLRNEARNIFLMSGPWLSIGKLLLLSFSAPRWRCCYLIFSSCNIKFPKFPLSLH